MAQTNTNKDLDSWDDFCGSNFLSVKNVSSESDAFVVIAVEEFVKEGESPKVRITLEKGEENFTFDLNVTNANFCKNAEIKSPKQLIGKKFFFKKVLVMSPKTKKEVESLRISKIE